MDIQKDNVYKYEMPRISLRDHFAGMVLGAIGTGSFDNEIHRRAYAKMEAEYAYIVADAMLEARKKDTNP